jgi:hypothetical protein
VQAAKDTTAQGVLGMILVGNYDEFAKWAASAYLIAANLPIALLAVPVVDAS